MKINHRIALGSDDLFWRDIDRLGLDIEQDNETIWVLNVTEDNPAWPDVDRLIAAHKSPIHSIENIFSKHELDSAQWLRVFALGHHGYPQPENGFGYIAATYDVSDCCPTCCIGKIQKAPFRLRAEPKASHSQFLQLNWVFDEYFLRSAASDGLAEAGITGIEFLAPVLHKRNSPSAQIVQMKVKTVLPPAIDLSGLQQVTCKPFNEESRAIIPLETSELGSHLYCGRVKYHVMCKGPFRLSCRAFEGAPDVVKSHEWFGSGGLAFQLVIVSQRFRQVVTGAKWRGLGFEPIMLIGEFAR